MNSDSPWFKKIDHLGIAIPSLETALPVYETLFFGDHGIKIQSSSCANAGSVPLVHMM